MDERIVDGPGGEKFLLARNPEPHPDRTWNTLAHYDGERIHVGSPVGVEGLMMVRFAAAVGA